MAAIPLALDQNRRVVAPLCCCILRCIALWYGFGDRMLALSVTMTMKSKEFREKVQGQRGNLADSPSQKSADAV